MATPNTRGGDLINRQLPNPYRHPSYAPKKTISRASDVLNRAPTQRAPEAKVRRANPTMAVAPKTITSPAPRVAASGSSWKSASASSRKFTGANLSSHVAARDAARKSGDKAAYAKAQNAINQAYGVKKRHSASREDSSFRMA